MNLIEKVAKVLCLKCSGKSWEHVESFYGDHYYMEAAVVIDAMPSIKWQKIETLKPEEDKPILAWTNKAIVLTWSYAYKEFYNDDGVSWKLHELTHWAEINAPEEE